MKKTTKILGLVSFVLALSLFGCAQPAASDPVADAIDLAATATKDIDTAAIADKDLSGEYTYVILKESYNGEKVTEKDTTLATVKITKLENKNYKVEYVKDSAYEETSAAYPENYNALEKEFYDALLESLWNDEYVKELKEEMEDEAKLLGLKDAEVSISKTETSIKGTFENDKELYADAPVSMLLSSFKTNDDYTVFAKKTEATFMGTIKTTTAFVKK